jgi:hypothetical protein
MMYGSTLWWQDTGLVKAGEYLEKVHNQALRLICACFRTTPVYALQLEAAIPPIQIHLSHIAEREAIRLHRLGRNHPLLIRLPAEWKPPGEREVLHPSVPLSVEPPRVRRARVPQALRSTSSAPRLWTIAALTDPKAEKKTAAHDHKNKISESLIRDDHLLIYTDGSRRSIDGVNCTGA